MRLRTIVLALAAALIVPLGIQAPAQAANVTVVGPAFTVQGARCYNTVQMYTSGSEVVAIATISCTLRFPTITSEINLHRYSPDRSVYNQRLCTGNPTGCSTSVRIPNPSGSQLFGAHANCALDSAGTCRFGWGANVSFRA